MNQTVITKNNNEAFRIEKIAFANDSPDPKFARNPDPINLKSTFKQRCHGCPKCKPGSAVVRLLFYNPSSTPK